MEQEQHKQAVKQANASLNAAEELAALRRQVDEIPGGQDRPIVAAVDGGLTNTTLIRNLPPRTSLIGRLRKDAVLYHAPLEPETPGRGRPKSYGARLPTPEAIRKNDIDHPWQTVRAFAAGKEHTMRIKTVAPVRWRGLGAADGRLVVIAPLAYKLTQHGYTSYREPGYLLCTDPDLDLTSILQTYIHRWEIELNFRDEKTILGLGEAQVRNPESVEGVPQLLTAAYSMLLLAAEKENQKNKEKGKTPKSSLPPPKWRERNPPPRTTTQQILNDLRGEILRHELQELNLTDFASNSPPGRKGKKKKLPFVMAPVYSQK